MELAYTVRLISDDPRCVQFVDMLRDYGLNPDLSTLKQFLQDSIPVEKTSPRKINDKREYYRTVYLKTDHWKALKQGKLQAVKECEFCGTPNHLDVHHRRYRNLYDVDYYDLAVLCRRCHDDLHASVDDTLTGYEKEQALDTIFMSRLPPERLREIQDRADCRLRFNRLLQRMISVASKIRKNHGLILADKVRPFFADPLRS